MLTVKAIEAAEKRAKKIQKRITLTDATTRGIGSLRLRLSPNGSALWMYRYTKQDGTRDDMPMTVYGDGGLSLDEARTKAADYAKLYRDGHKDLRAYLDDLAATESAKLQQQQDEVLKAQAGSLGALLDAYVAYLEGRKAPSVKDVRNIIELHVHCFPDLVKRRANTITPHDLRAIFDRQQANGLTRTLGKTRAILHSAFNLAAKSEFNSVIPRVFRDFAVSTNPASVLPSYAEQSTPGEYVLTHPEIKTLVSTLKADNRVSAMALLVGLYLGGQRPQQLLRVTASDVDLDRGIITLHDGKGKRARPRLHVLPITDTVRPILGTLLEINGKAPSLFSSDGKTIIHMTTVSKLARTIGSGAYQMKDIRRTCETELAAIGVDKGVRAQILSHELGGIQNRHYDRHSYIDEKRDALTRWERHLDGIAAGNVVSLRRGA